MLLTAAVAMTTAGKSFANVDNVFTGTQDSNWNNDNNWSLGHTPTNTTNPQEDAVINLSTTNIPTISADFTRPPTDLFVGRDAGTTGVLNQPAGTAANAGGNWMFVGADGSTGTWNLGVTGATTNLGVNSQLGLGSGSINDTGRMYVGGRHVNAPGTGTMNINTTGFVTTGNDFAIGASNGNGVVNLDAGALSVGGWLLIGSDHNGSTATGTINMSGGSITMPNNTPIVTGNFGSTGTLKVTGGTVNTVGELWVGNGVGGGHPSNGTTTVSGGAVTINNWIAVGRNGSVGTLNVSGGSVTKAGTGSEITIGTGAGGNGTVNVSGGALTSAEDIILAENNATATGTVNQTGGIVTTGRNLEIQRNGIGSYNLSGGKLFVNGTLMNANGGTFNFTGGSLSRTDAAAPLAITGNLSPGGKVATLGLDHGKTFTLSGTLNVDPGFTLDLTGDTVPSTGSGLMPLGTVGGVLGTFDTASNPIVGLTAPAGATYIDENAGETPGTGFNPATQSVYWLQENGGQVSLGYSIAATPEPTLLSLLAIPTMGLIARRRRRPQ